jgi:hypothetical protein
MNPKKKATTNTAVPPDHSGSRIHRPEARIAARTRASIKYTESRIVR